MTKLRMLGVVLVDPSDRAAVQAAVSETLRERVVEPIRRLVADVDGGAQPATAYWLLTRFVLPNLMYHAQAWGLLCEDAAWAETDAALDAFCAAVCPADLRDGLRREHSELRHELSLPQSLGGLGIPIVAQEARHRAAEQWGYRDATEAGMLPDLAASAFRREDGVLSRGEWSPIGVGRHFEAVIAGLRAGHRDVGAVAWERRREQNCLRAGMWAFNAVPWERDLTLTHAEWDVAWRLAFGGMVREVRTRIDAPIGGFVGRGRKMEYAVMAAMHECLPAGTVRTWAQPSPEFIPPDHVARCERVRCSPDAWRRADIAAECMTGKVVTLDVRTVHLQAASAVPGHASAAAHINALEREKRGKYAAYYSHFRPFVISISGAVPETTYGVLKEIAKEAAKVSGPRRGWEKFGWVVSMMKRIAVAAVRAVAWDATRAVGPREERGGLSGLLRGDLQEG